MMRLHVAFLFTTFQANRIMCLCLSHLDEKKKNRRNFWRFISWKPLVQICWNLGCEVVYFYCKNCLVSWKLHGATYMWKLHYCSSCWARQHTTCVLILSTVGILLWLNIMHYALLVSVLIVIYTFTKKQVLWKRIKWLKITASAWLQN